MGYRLNPFTGEFDRVDDSTVGLDIETLTGNSGGAVGPDGAQNVDVLGDNTQGIDIVGDAGLFNLTVSGIDATETQIGVSELATDAEAIAGSDSVRTIVPTSLKAKLGTQTANSMPYGQGDTLALGWSSALTDGQVVIGSTGLAPAGANLTSSGGTVTITNGPNTINLEAASSVATTYTTDSGNAVPSGNVLRVFGGTVVAGTTPVGTTGAGNLVTINSQISQALAAADATKIGLCNFSSADFTVDADGFVGSTTASFTQGSVIFMGASALAQDNANFFWDDTNNRLGIGTTTPSNSLQIVGEMNLMHTATNADDHALEIICDTAGFGDVKALDIQYATGALAAGDEEEGILLSVDETLSTGGTVKGYEVLTTGEGTTLIFGYSTGINVCPILHNSGTFGDADDILNKAVDVTAALASGGAGSISGFVADNDTMTIGDAAQFGELEIILGTVASGAGIAPVFEYSTGGVGFSAFSPSDGTNGFRSTGSILWDANDLAGWIANATGFFEIRITRTRNVLGTTPIFDEIQIAALTQFIWDASANVNINSLTLVTPLTVPNGGTGLAATTAYAVLCGGTTSTAALQSIASVGTAAQVLTSNGAGALPTFQVVGGGGISWVEVTGTSQAMAVSTGYILNNAGLVTATLPAVAALGDVMRLVGKGAGGWSLAQNAGQTVHFGSSDTTAGAGGSLASTDPSDSIEILCTTANTNFTIISSIGNITVV